MNFIDLAFVPRSIVVTPCLLNAVRQNLNVLNFAEQRTNRTRVRRNAQGLNWLSCTPSLSVGGVSGDSRTVSKKETRDIDRGHVLGNPGKAQPVGPNLGRLFNPLR